MLDREALAAAAKARFPAAELLAEKGAVKSYPTFRLPKPADLEPFLAWLRDEQGFSYLHMLTATDWHGQLNLDGYIRDPNFNVFLPEGATPEINEPTKQPGVDYRETIELVYALMNLPARLSVFVKVEVPREGGAAPTACGLFPAADWQEREVYDLLGVDFTGHPNLTKILTPEFLAGHPLRKDYAHKKDRFD